jgi:hypothetical protein
VYVGHINLYSTIGAAAATPYSFANGYVRTESASAQFLSYDASGLAAISGLLFADDYLAGCTLNSGLSARLVAVNNALNVGDQVLLQGPGGQQLSLLPQNPGPPNYSGAVPAGPAANSPDLLPQPYFSSGQWQASASGSSVVEPFAAMVMIPDPIQITNYTQVRMVDHTKDLTIRWDPATYSTADIADVQLFNRTPAEWFNTSNTLFCQVPATAGIVTIPAAMLASFEPASGSLSVMITRRPDVAAMFTVGLNEGTSIPAVFQYYSTESVFVQFQ